jgi:hypothetical protein
MSVSPEPPERLTEILLEILALSNPTQKGQSESVRGDDSKEVIGAHGIKEHPQRKDKEDDKR